MGLQGLAWSGVIGKITSAAPFTHYGQVHTRSPKRDVVVKQKSTVTATRI